MMKQMMMKIKNKYIPLDVKSLVRNNKVTTVSLEDLLEDIIPLKWSEDVLLGKVKVIIQHKNS